MSVPDKDYKQEEDESISLVELLLVLARYKRLLLILPLVLAVLAGTYAMLATKIFQAETVLMPPQQQQSSASAMLAQLGGLGGSAGGMLGIKNPNDIYVGMLNSRTIADRLVVRFKLEEVYRTKTRSQTVKALGASTKIVAGKDGLISISVMDTVPKRAAEMANAYVEELRSLSKVMAVTEAQQRRLFFERQLHGAKEQLADAEVALKLIQQKTGILDVAAQGQATITALTQLKASIAAKEVEMTAMRSFATGNNPNYVRVQGELSGLKVQLQRLMNGQDEGDVLIIKSKAPQLSLDYIRKLRDVKYQETLFEIIARQYEIARIDESKEGALIQVIDKAVPPERKIKPKGATLVLMGLAAGLVLSVLLAFVLEALKKAQQGPDAARLHELRAALRWRRPAG